MNAIFVANKPANISSNHFLSQLKRRYNVKKAGFSGTLDPFASGALIVAFGDYTKLFQFLDKTPKIYTATMWLGASSLSGDNENILDVKTLKPFTSESIEIARQNLLGKITYTPPKFSAKQINGKRAYELARKGVEFELKPQTMNVFKSEILSYAHPFLTFRVNLNEGAYVRSYAQMFAAKLGVSATLSALNRESEGEFKFENERFLDIKECLKMPNIKYFGEISDITNGKKLNANKFSTQKDGAYLLDYDEFFSIIKILNNEVFYSLNKIKKH